MSRQLSSQGCNTPSPTLVTTAVSPRSPPPNHQLPRGRQTPGKRKVIVSGGVHSPDAQLCHDGHISDVEVYQGRRKAVKVTRACDTCKSRKTKCTGTMPCEWCLKKGVTCRYDAKYTRGQASAPPALRDTPEGPSSGVASTRSNGGNPGVDGHQRTRGINAPLDYENEITKQALSSPQVSILDSAPPSRASPELGVAEIQGEYHDRTSGLAFLHRACRRLSEHQRISRTASAQAMSGFATEDSFVLTAGDKPTHRTNAGLPSVEKAKALVSLYFDWCMATYRILHYPTVEKWLGEMTKNTEKGRPISSGIGRARAAIIFLILAIATAHQERSNGAFLLDEHASMARSDGLFSSATDLLEKETSMPTLESAQARITQVLYLLITSRMNQAWYVFGTAIQLISALGLHRRTYWRRRDAQDYIQAQCRIRTFWTAYTLDKYLGVMFGRPRHFHDDDIDQDEPDRVNDEDMTEAGPATVTGHKDCYIDALIYHARIAKIIGNASGTVYSIHPIAEQERAVSARKLSEQLQAWRQGLPPFLGAVHPSSLIVSFRRQATALSLAYCHAVMHINRPFLLQKSSFGNEVQITEAIRAASTVLETVDEFATEGGPIFQAFWWTHYITFCALAIVYAWQLRHHGADRGLQVGITVDVTKLGEVATRCHTHLAQVTASNSPSRRYSIILEELRHEATRQTTSTKCPASSRLTENHGEGVSGVSSSEPQVEQAVSGALGSAPGKTSAISRLLTDDLEPLPSADVSWSLDEWQTENWLELDSLAFGVYGVGDELNLSLSLA